MGFDMSISCNLSVCQATGRPYFIGKNGAKVFDLAQIAVVPEEFRRFLQLRGPVFYEYTRSFGEYETIVDAVMFLDGFPPWDEVEEYADRKWDSTDHNKFYAAVQWFVNADVNYLVSWSY